MSIIQQTSGMPERRRRATYQDLLDAPPHQVAEIIDGTLHTHPRPSGSHAIAYSSLGGELVTSFQKGRGGPGGWWIVDEPEMHLGGDILVPDLAGWRRERLPVYPKGPFVTLSPDWVCEILSPSTRNVDLHGKRPIYAREGVGHLWLIDPEKRSLDAYELQEGDWAQIASLHGYVDASVPPFDAITFNLGEIWLPDNMVHEPPAPLIATA